MRSLRLLLGLSLVATGLTLIAPASVGAAPPDAPSSLSVTPGVHELTVDWSASLGADRYVARLIPTARQITTTAPGPVTFDRLVAGVEYAVTVTPVDDVDGYGEASTASATPTDQPLTPPQVVEVSAGDDNTCALLDDGTVRCWGSDRNGELGRGVPAGDDDRSLGDDEPITRLPAVDVGARVVQVSVGGGHTCAVTEAAAVRCWGNSKDGGLGYPGVEVVGVRDVPAELGDVNVGSDVAQVTAGDDHTCVLTTAGRVRCWGRGDDGRLGHVDTDDIGDDEAPATAGDVRLGTRAVEVSAGRRHTCAITAAGAVRCWGRGDDGQLGYANTDDLGDDEPPSAAGDVTLGAFATAITSGRVHNCVITTSMAVRCWGDNGSGQLLQPDFRRIGNDETPASAGDVPIDAAVTEVAAGGRHTCVVAPSAGLGCWGRNRDGELGYGTDDGGSRPILRIGAVPLGDTPVDVALGDEHSCALTEPRTLRCFGEGGSGQLGYGSDDDVGDDETPDSLDAVDLVTAPGAPAVTATGGEGSLSISYSAPDDDGGAPISTYRILAEPGSNSVTQRSAGRLTLIGLQTGTTYTISVTATNDYGTSPAVPVIAATDSPGGAGAAGSGYWMVDRQGGLFDFGDAAAFGAVAVTPGSTVVDLDTTPSGNGLWVLDSAGVVHTRGDATSFGNITAGTTGRPTTLAPTPAGDGYWIFTTTGDVSTHGTALDHGDLTDLALNGPVIASAATTTGGGYWLLGTDGGVFALGDAVFFGSMGGIPLNRPVNGISPDPDGRGYWLVADDGGVFAFEADFRGSVPGVLAQGVTLNAPVTGLIPYGNGYAMVATDGGAFVFSDQDFVGSLGGQQLDHPIVAMTTIG